MALRSCDVTGRPIFDVFLRKRAQLKPGDLVDRDPAHMFIRQVLELRMGQLRSPCGGAPRVTTKQVPDG